jgi:N6-adenosine-specific RNA methylase IME4
MTVIAAPLPHHYKVIYTDPPWTFATYSRKGKGRSAEAHYDCLPFADIKALPVDKWAAPDCALFLWITDPSLPQAFEVIEATGRGRYHSRSAPRLDRRVRIRRARAKLGPDIGLLAGR